MLLALPDHGRGWILRCAARARSLIRRVQPKVVVSSGPPHSAHFATWLATRGLGVPWLVDLRDTWTGLTSEAWRDSPLYRSRVARGTQNKLERLVARYATAFSANSEWLADALAARYPHLAVHWVPNGVDRELLPSASADPFRGVGIVYTGALFGWRNLEPVLRALRSFLDRHPEAEARESKLRVAGALDAAQVSSLRATAASLGVSSHVEVLGLLPRHEALGLLARSRLAVVLAQGQVVEVPAKLYEPVGMGIPCVVLAPAESAPAAEAMRLGAKWVGPNDHEALARLLEDVWAGRVRVGSGLSPAGDYDTVARQVSQLLSELADGAS